MSNWDAALQRPDIVEKLAALRIKPPRSPAAAADLYYKTRADRYALNAQAKELEMLESVLKDLFVAVLPKDDATGVTGKIAQVKVEGKTHVQVVSWEEFQAYIARRRAAGAFAMLQRRVNEESVKEVWAAGKKVPGTEPIIIPRVSATKA